MAPFLAPLPGHEEISIPERAAFAAAQQTRLSPRQPSVMQLIGSHLVELREPFLVIGFFQQA